MFTRLITKQTDQSDNSCLCFILGACSSRNKNFVKRISPANRASPFYMQPLKQQVITTPSSVEWNTCVFSASHTYIKAVVQIVEENHCKISQNMERTVFNQKRSKELYNLGSVVILRKRETTRYRM